MYRKNTSELEEALEQMHTKDIGQFVDENAEDMLDGERDFMKYMKAKLKEKGILKQDVLLRADISQGYGYKLLTEEKGDKAAGYNIADLLCGRFFFKGNAAGIENISYGYTLCQRYFAYDIF